MLPFLAHSRIFKGNTNKELATMVVHALNPSTKEAEAGGSVTLRPDKAIQERNWAAKVRGQVPQARPGAWNQVRYKSLADSITEYNKERKKDPLRALRTCDSPMDSRKPEARLLWRTEGCSPRHFLSLSRKEISRRLNFAIT